MCSIFLILSREVYQEQSLAPDEVGALLQVAEKIEHATHLSLFQLVLHGCLLKDCFVAFQ